jgi:hypothetical protein
VFHCFNTTVALLNLNKNLPQTRGNKLQARFCDM